MLQCIISVTCSFRGLGGLEGLEYLGEGLVYLERWSNLCDEKGELLSMNSNTFVMRKERPADLRLLKSMVP